MRNFTHTFDGSGTDTWYVPAAAGKHVRVQSAGAGIDVYTLAQGSVVAQGLALLGGDGFESDLFDSLKVNSPTAQTVTVAISKLPIESNRSAGGTVSVAPPGNATSSADQAIATLATYTIPANPNRTALIVGSLSNNAPAAGKNLRAGANAAAANGRELAPGTFQVFTTTAAIKVYNPDAGGQTIWIDEEIK